MLTDFLDEDIEKARMEALRDGLKEGLKEGLKDGYKEGKIDGAREIRKEMIIKMIENKLDYDTIQYISGASDEEIEKIEDNIIKNCC